MSSDGRPMRRVLSWAHSTVLAASQFAGAASAAGASGALAPANIAKPVRSRRSI